MNAKTLNQIPSLNNLEYISYLDKNGNISEQFSGKIGAYAIFDRDKQLQYAGYSRDINLSLKQHLVRKIDLCYWVKVSVIDKPSRKILEATCQNWIAENGSIPPGNSSEEKEWTSAIDTKNTMTSAEKEEYQNISERERIKLLKKIARKVEAGIKEKLKNRGVTTEMRFNPKLKEKGLLDLK